LSPAASNEFGVQLNRASNWLPKPAIPEQGVTHRSVSQLLPNVAKSNPPSYENNESNTHLMSGYPKIRIGQLPAQSIQDFLVVM